MIGRPPLSGGGLHETEAEPDHGVPMPEPTVTARLTTDPGLVNGEALADISAVEYVFGPLNVRTSIEYALPFFSPAMLQEVIEEDAATVQEPATVVPDRASASYWVICAPFTEAGATQETAAIPEPTAGPTAATRLVA